MRGVNGIHLQSGIIQEEVKKGGAGDRPQLPESQERRASLKTTDTDEPEQIAQFLLDCREVVAEENAEASPPFPAGDRGDTGDVPVLAGSPPPGVRPLPWQGQDTRRGGSGAKIVRTSRPPLPDPTTLRSMRRVLRRRFMGRTHGKIGVLECWNTGMMGREWRTPRQYSIIPLFHS
jgi:hypothetical protein